MANALAIANAWFNIRSAWFTRALPSNSLLVVCMCGCRLFSRVACKWNIPAVWTSGPCRKKKRRRHKSANASVSQLAVSQALSFDSVCWARVSSLRWQQRGRYWHSYSFSPLYNVCQLNDVSVLIKLPELAHIRCGFWVSLLDVSKRAINVKDDKMWLDERPFIAGHSSTYGYADITHERDV